MKLVIATIQPTKVDAVRQALHRVEIFRMTVCDAQAYKHRTPDQDAYRGQGFSRDLMRRVELHIVVNDDFLDLALQAIAEVGRTGAKGTLGDGKVFVLPVVDVIDIADGARGPGAIN